LYFHSCFAVRLLGPLPLIFMMVSLSSRLRIFWDTNLLLHFIVLHQISLNHYMAVLVLLSDDVHIILFYFD
jgi:hypothetical protein